MTRSMGGESMRGAVIALDGERLFVLANMLEVDGRTSWFAPAASGWSPMNSYLLREPGGALLVDTGVSVHEAALLEQLAGLVEPGESLALLHTRLGEFNATCNSAAVMERFTVDAMYGAFASHLFLDYRPALQPPPEGPDRWHGRAVQERPIATQTPIVIGSAGTRRLEAFTTPLRLLSTHWLYDEATRTLMTSDSFGHAYADTPDGPWVVDETCDTTTIDEVRMHLLTKFGWLAGADTTPAREGLAAIFERLDVETIAPGYGRVLHGRAVVERHVAMVDDVLATLQDERSAAA